MAGQATLVYTADSGEKHDLVLDPKTKSTIGRHPQCTLFVNQPSVSRRHARLWFENGSWVVEDLKSSNGTFVNNQRVDRKNLSEGDELRCGDFAMTYLQEDRTREVSDVASTGTSRSPSEAQAPRVVGSLGSPRKPIPPPDPKIADRATVGLADDLNRAFPKAPVSEPPAAKDSPRIAELERDLATAQRQLKSSRSDVERLEKERNQLEDANNALQEQLRVSAQKATSSSSDDEWVDSLVEIYEDLDSFTSETKLKLKLSGGLIEDLSPVVEAMEKIRNMDLPHDVQNLVRMAVDDSDAADTMGAAISTFREAERAVRSTRRMIRLLREVLRQRADH